MSAHESIIKNFKKKRSVLFLCKYDWAGVATRLSYAINKYTDWAALCVVSELTLGMDDLVLKDKHPTIIYDNKKEIDRIIDDADVIIQGSSFSGWHTFDRKKDPGKLLGLWHGGSAYRKDFKKFNGSIHPYYDFIFAHRDLENLDSKNIRLNACIDTVKTKYINKNWYSKIKIGHTPSKTDVKGTRIFLQAMEYIKKKYADVEIELISNMSHEEVMKRKKKFHILFDQIGNYNIPRDGTCGYGMSLIESAALGSVCLSWSDYVNTPIICVKNAADIEREISFLMDNRRKMEELSKVTREWVIKEHGYRAVADRFISFLDINMNARDPDYVSIDDVIHHTMGVPNPFTDSKKLWIRDIPHIQVDNKEFKFPPRRQKLIDDAEFFIWVGPDERSELVEQCIFHRKVPHATFYNYQNYKYSKDDKRDEILYLDNSSANYDNFSRILYTLEESKIYSGLNTVFTCRPRFLHVLRMLSKKYSVSVMDTPHYDFNSRYGIITDTIDNPDYTRGYYRKFWLYLSHGMVPIIHEKYKDMIKYCIDNDINHFAYDEISDLRNIDIYPNHNKYKFTFEYQYPEILKILKDKTVKLSHIEKDIISVGKNFMQDVIFNDNIRIDEKDGQIIIVNNVIIGYCSRGNLCK